MSKITKFLPIIVTSLLALIGANSVAVTAYISAHPGAATILAGVYAIIHALLPSPLPPTPPTQAK